MIVPIYILNMIYEYCGIYRKTYQLNIYCLCEMIHNRLYEENIIENNKLNEVHPLMYTFFTNADFYMEYPHLNKYNCEGTEECEHCSIKKSIYAY